MPAGIEKSDGLFTVRMAAWHGLGQTLEDYPTREEAQKIAHPWEPVEEPLYRKRLVMIGEDQEPREEFVKVDSAHANVRSDNGEELGVVKTSFTLVTNNELWDVAEALEQSGGDVMFETAGSLDGGSRVWILIRLQEPILIKGDPRGETIPYYALQNSHDGTGAFRGQATMTRIVCANTARVADLDAKARGTEFTFRHTSKVAERVEEARQALSSWRESLAQYQDLCEELIQETLEPTSVSKFLDRFIPTPPPSMVTERVMANVVADRQKWMDAYNSVTGEGLKNTSYGLVQASVEFLEWGRRAYNAESRFKRSFLTRNQMVTEAVRMAREAARA